MYISSRVHLLENWYKVAVCIYHHVFICRKVDIKLRYVYSYFEKGCRKKCTRQSRKALWVVLSSLFFKEVWKNGTRGHGCMFARAKGEQQKQVRQLQCQDQCNDHVPYYLLGLSRTLFLQMNTWWYVHTATLSQLFCRWTRDDIYIPQFYINFPI